MAHFGQESAPLAGLFGRTFENLCLETAVEFKNGLFVAPGFGDVVIGSEQLESLASHDNATGHLDLLKFTVGLHGETSRAQPFPTSLASRI